MDREHAAILAAIKRAGRTGPEARQANDSYLGSGHLYYGTPVPDRRAIAKAWLAAHKAAGAAEVLAVAESLLDGESHDEKTVACFLVALHAPIRRAVRPEDVDRWLGRLNGWAEVDGLCQNLFKAEDMLADWPAWLALIERLSRAADLNRRRASLVLLTGPTHYSADTRFRDLAFAMIERAKGERDIMITKAVSWLLRSMTTRHGEVVARYVEDNAASLPAIAVRETWTKLRTGKKTG